jgi:hypothetical protein
VSLAGTSCQFRLSRVRNNEPSVVVPTCGFAPEADGILARGLSGEIVGDVPADITSLVMLATAVGPMIRAHWAIENSLHWVI